MTRKFRPTTMRLPPRTLEIIDAKKGDKSRTEFLVDLVDNMPVAAGESLVSCVERSYEESCYYGAKDSR